MLRASSRASAATSFRLRITFRKSGAEVTIWAWSHPAQSKVRISKPDDRRTRRARFMVESHFGQRGSPAGDRGGTGRGISFDICLPVRVRSSSRKAASRFDGGITGTGTLVQLVMQV